MTAEGHQLVRNEFSSDTHMLAQFVNTAQASAPSLQCTRLICVLM